MSRARITNAMLGGRVSALEVEVKQLQKDLAPLRDGMTEIKGMMKLAGFFAGALSFLGTAVSIWAALRR